MQSALDYLPEFLLYGTLLTGAIWLYDLMVWRKQRLAAVEALEARTPLGELESDGFLYAREELHTRLRVR